MSWDSYRDQLVASGCIQKAAICGMDGAVWTSSDGIGVSPDEVKSLVASLAKDGGVSMASTGVIIGGVKYMYLMSDDSQVQGKKGAGGVSVAKSKSCVLIGIYGENMQPGNCRVKVEKMKDYLMSAGY